MGAAIALARGSTRGRVASLVGLALVVALGVGTTLAAAEAPARTERADPDYLRDAEVAELVVNPSFSSERAREVIETTPGVSGVTSDSWWHRPSPAEAPAGAASPTSSGPAEERDPPPC